MEGCRLDVAGAEKAYPIPTGNEKRIPTREHLSPCRFLRLQSAGLTENATSCTEKPGATSLADDISGEHRTAGKSRAEAVDRDPQRYRQRETRTRKVPVSGVGGY